jgi:hypothetical protein
MICADWLRASSIRARSRWAAPAASPDAAREKLLALNIMDLSPAELEQFVYDVNVGRPEGRELRLTTDESDVSGFLKIMIHNGAKVEVFSAHDHPEEPSRA